MLIPKCECTQNINNININIKKLIIKCEKIEKQILLMKPYINSNTQNIALILSKIDNIEKKLNDK